MLLNFVLLYQNKEQYVLLSLDQKNWGESTGIKVPSDD